MPRIETERLVLRLPEEADIDALDAMDTDPEVMRYIGDGKVHPRTREQTAGFVAATARKWAERGLGWLSVTSRETGEFLGWVILAEPAFLPEVMPTVEIGWRFRREHWGQGYATEAARPFLHHAFTACGLEQLVSIADIENTASHHVMEKLGLRFGHETVVPSSGRRVAVYQLSRAEYEAMGNR
ncbi:MAG TPA: GNAT family N-acetyltransferase [Actinospica sp.]|nr:GNAT family N-acetyltransferase [Actinospica sp.]